MPAHAIIVIGASAGGIEPLKQLVGALLADLPAALFSEDRRTAVQFARQRPVIFVPCTNDRAPGR